MFKFLASTLEIPTVHGKLPPSDQKFFRKLEKLGLERRYWQLFSKKLFKPHPGHLESEIWFDMVAYMSDPHGVRSYLENYKWLKRFILHSDPDGPENFEETFVDFQGARVEFELRPGSFIGKVERFSALLKARDLCKSLLSYLGKDYDANIRDIKLKFWIELHTQIHNIVDPSTNRTPDHNDFIGPAADQVLESLQKFCGPGMEESQSSTAEKIQNFLEHAFDDDELTIRHKSE